MANGPPRENGAASVPAGAAPVDDAALRDGFRKVLISDYRASPPVLKTPEVSPDAPLRLITPNGRPND